MKTALLTACRRARPDIKVLICTCRGAEGCRGGHAGGAPYLATGPQEKAADCSVACLDASDRNLVCYCACAEERKHAEKGVQAVGHALEQGMKETVPSCANLTSGWS